MKYLVTVVVLALFQGLNAQELIADTSFQWGFEVKDASGTVEGNIQYNPQGKSPAWNIAQWGSNSSVYSLTPTVEPSGFYKWANSHKDFRFGPEGVEEYDLYYGVNSQNEYGNVYRQSGEAWPHLLVEQRFNAPFSHTNHGPGSKSLAELSALNFHVEAKLLYNNTIKNAGYTTGLHAGQFLVFFTVQNLNQSSAGYGKIIWLGIPVYDDRNPMVGGGVSYDIATATLINNIPYIDCASETMYNGNWVDFDVDILPYAKQALDTAWSKGFLDESTDLNDYKIGGMNMGWELPGMNIATVVVRGISLKAENISYVGVEEAHESTNLLVYPNPSEGSFTVQLTLHETADVTISLLNLLGEEILQVCKGEKKEGLHRLPIQNKSLASGHYICRVIVGNSTSYQKVVVSD